MVLQYLLNCQLKPSLFGHREFTHSLPADLQLLHLLQQPVVISWAVLRQILDRPLQCSYTAGALPKLTLKHLHPRKFSTLNNTWLSLSKRNHLALSVAKYEPCACQSNCWPGLFPHTQELLQLVVALLCTTNHWEPVGHQWICLKTAGPLPVCVALKSKRSENGFSIDFLQQSMLKQIFNSPLTGFAIDSVPGVSELWCHILQVLCILKALGFLQKQAATFQTGLIHRPFWAKKLLEILTVWNIRILAEIMHLLALIRQIQFYS